MTTDTASTVRYRPTSGELVRRLALVRQHMADANIDVLVSADTGGWLPPTGDARYLTGFTYTSMAPVLPGQAVLVGREGDVVLIVPSGPQGEFEEWARRSTDRVRVVAAGPGFALALAAATRQVAAPGGVVGIEQPFADFGELVGLLGADYTVRDAAALRVRPLALTRAVKSDEELELLSAAQRAADAGMVTFHHATRIGERLAVAQAASRNAAIRAGAEDALVIMNAGADPWVWWHFQDDRRFPDHGIVSLEVNARVGGYVAQLARSWTIGEPRAADERLLQAGIASTKAMVARIRGGATGHDIWDAGIAPLREVGLDSWGRLGHGMGLAMDEGVAVVNGDPIALEVGSVVAVHAAPWDATRRASALIGEQYVVTADGARLLSETVPDRDARVWAHGETEDHQ